jgi:hypothetical protein
VSTLPTHPYRSLIEDACQYAHPVPPDVLEAMVWVESNFDPNARSASNAIGLTQVISKWHVNLIRSVAVSLSMAYSHPDEALLDPQLNLRVGARHLKWCYGECGSWESAVAKYHSGQCVPPEGFVDGQGTSTVRHVEKFRAALTQVKEAHGQTADIVEDQEEPMATHRYILSGGHRNENRGGARHEIDWTYPSVVALKAEIEARGGKAWIVHEHDGDSDPTFSRGRGLQNVARRCVELAQQLGGVDAYISSHYNGGGSPGFHAIFPDGWSAPDRKADNPLDVRLCRRMRDAVKATNTVRMLGWTADSPGVMSERETHVGSQGFRLGEFVGTLGFRDTTARVIIEAGSIDTWESSFIQNPAWVRNTYAVAIVDALEDVFGEFAGETTAPVPEKPATVYAKPAPAPWAAPLRDGSKTSVTLPDGTTWFVVNNLYRAKRDTPRRQYAIESGAEVGEPVPSGSVFMIDAVGTGTDAGPYALSPWDTRFDLDDLELVQETEQPDLLADAKSALKSAL